MDINKYFQDLMLCQEEKAEKLRVASIPDKLIKFIWLNGDIRDEKSLNRYQMMKYGFHIQNT